MKSVDTLILGGGLTGISCAYHLGPGHNWLLIDKEERLGGLCRTLEKDGFYFDVTGHYLHLRSEYAKQLVEKVFPDGFDMVARKSHVYSQGVFTHYPYQANTHGLPPETMRENLVGFFRAMENRLKNNPPPPKTFGEWILLYLGEGFAKNFMFPYNEKLWTVHPDEVSAHWCERFVPKPSWEQVIEGAIGMSQQALGYNAFFRYPKQGGIESMVRAFVSKLQGPIWTKTRPVRIDQRRRLVELDNGETIAYRHLVSSAAMTHLVRMMDNPPAEVTEAAARLRATTVVYYNMAVKYYGAPNSHWIYYPEKKYPFYRVGSFSSVHPSLAPPGGISLYVETAHGKADVDPMSLWPAILEGLIEAKILRGADDIVFCSPGTIPNAYVIFDNNFEAATAAISGYCDAHEINSTGRFGKWTYSSMEDSILWGVEAAERARKAAPRPETDTP